MIGRVLRYLTKEDVAMLGRWSLKKCDSSKLVTFYNNRDHCGDMICKEASKYCNEKYDTPKTKST